MLKRILNKKNPISTEMDKLDSSNESFKILYKIYKKWISSCIYKLEVLQLWVSLDEPKEIVLKRSRDYGPIVGDMLIWQNADDKYDEVQIAITTLNNYNTTVKNQRTTVKNLDIIYIKIYGKDVGKIYDRDTKLSECKALYLFPKQYAYIPGNSETTMHFLRLAWVAQNISKMSSTYRPKFIKTLHQHPVLLKIVEYFCKIGSHEYTTINMKKQNI
jgi:hypothetical protein